MVEINDIYVQLYAKDPSKLRTHKIQLVTLWLSNAFVRSTLYGIHPAIRYPMQFVFVMSIGQITDLIMNRRVFPFHSQGLVGDSRYSTWIFPSETFFEFTSQRRQVVTDKPLRSSLTSALSYQGPENKHNLFSWMNLSAAGASLLVSGVCGKVSKYPSLRAAFPLLSHSNPKVHLAGLFVGNMFATILAHMDLNAHLRLVKEE